MNKNGMYTWNCIARVATDVLWLGNSDIDVVRKL